MDCERSNTGVTTKITKISGNQLNALIRLELFLYANERNILVNSVFADIYILYLLKIPESQGFSIDQLLNKSSDHKKLENLFLHSFF